MTARRTPLGAIAHGLGAGLCGTALMTLTQELAAKLQSSSESGDQQQDEGQPNDPWEQASAPAKVARRFIEGVFEREVPPERIPLLTHAMHWGYGTSWGAVYGILESTSGGRSAKQGLLFGSGVWAMSYVQLVPMGLYEPPWKYPPKEVALDLSYHLAYGLGLVGGHRMLDRG
ncbi:MAG TPA: hypothetical protein VGR12_07820 [Solirubrobacteraceae bacterium]|nr:hypothetical protein [Solirubrobacteraceae bacterium]